MIRSFLASCFALGFVLAASGCDLLRMPQGGGGNGAGGSKEEGGGDAGGGDAGGGSACGPGSCADCRTCATNGPCFEVTQACLADPTCVGIDECLTLCGATPEECWETCRAQNPTGTDLYDAARGCIDCDVCEATCATAVVCGT